jgi:hypothetical protein
MYPELKKYLVSHCVPKTGNKDCFLYSSFNREKVFFIENKQQSKSKLNTIPYNFQINKDSLITFFECKKSDVFYYKNLYMSNRVDYSDGADLLIAFCMDGFVFGFASFSLRLSNFKEIYMISDFVVNSEIKKLSKLLIMIIRSSEVRKFISKKTHNFYSGIKTTVFTKNAVSMKYRGVFNLTARQQDSKTARLFYTSNFVEKPINEIFNEYKEKFLL